MTQVFELPWEPVAKARPRVVRARNGRSLTFTPEKTESAEHMLRVLLRQKRAQLFEREAPLSVDATFYVRRPQAPPKHGHPSRRPDIENYAKLLLDAGNGILWVDDAQVVELHARKTYGEPRLRLEVDRLERVSIAGEGTDGSGLTRRRPRPCANCGSRQHELTRTERRVLEGLGRGDPLKVIAGDVSLANGTVKHIAWRVRKKLHVHTNADALAKARRKGLIS